ncbi:MAG: NAD(P)H nitroreductase [Lachnospiraceae bacterium]|nr:NAD(P)H nitroreductase [Lachnospiraceae bacterium]
MNEVLNNILTRRSIRKFTGTPVPKEILEELVNAALHAPSGMGRQTWKFTVLTNKALLARLTSAIEKELDRPGYDMYRPAAVILPSNERDSRFGREDDACALENIFLAAHSLGIGSVWINQLQNICDKPDIRAVLDDLGIPADHVVYGMAALGYPDPDTPIQPKERIGKVSYVE